MTTTHSQPPSSISNQTINTQIKEKNMKKKQNKYKKCRELDPWAFTHIIALASKSHNTQFMILASFIFLFHFPESRAGQRVRVSDLLQAFISLVKLSLSRPRKCLCYHKEKQTKKQRMRGGGDHGQDTRVKNRVSNSSRGDRKTNFLALIYICHS